MTFANAYGGVREEGKPRVENDHYPTPPLATFALITNSNPPFELWEPAAGRGWMAWELERNNYCVTKSDLYPYADPVVEGIEFGRDFLNPNLADPSAKGVVTNPPYGRDMAQAFVERACENYSYVAVLCRLMFAESSRRFEMFSKKLPPSEVLVFSRRFSCDEKRFLDRPVEGMVSYAWWIWDYRDRQTRPGDTKMKWIDTKSIHFNWFQSLTAKEHEHMRKKLQA
jgi:hypothetical protein